MPKPLTRTTRFLVLTALLIATGGFIARTALTWKQRSARRSVVFWLIDTCRADHLSAYGYPRSTSPFLEAMAAHGVVFENCFAQAPWTKPSMASLLTSLPPPTTGVFGLLDRLDASFLTLPEALRAEGYNTAGFSANPIMGRMSNYTQGFRTFREASQVIPGGDIFHQAGGSAAALTRQVTAWLDDAAAQPFFLYIHSVDSHEEYRPAPAYLARFADPEGEPRYRHEWSALESTHPGQLGNRCTQASFDAAGIAAAPFVDYGMRLYDAGILATDDAIGALWRHLETLGLAGKIVFVVTSDHGEEFFEHGGTSHGFSLYDELLHVPLIVWAPGLLPGGRRVRAPVQLLDVYPTLLDLLGIRIPRGLAGRSLVPWLRAEPPAAPAPAIYAAKREDANALLRRYPTGNAYSLIRWPWKYILNLKPPAELRPPRHELYNLEEDPHETRNLVAEQPDMVARDEAEVLDWAKRTERPQSRTARPPDLTEPGLKEQLRALGYLR